MTARTIKRCTSSKLVASLFLQLGIPEAKIGVDWMHRYAGMRQYELRAISRANFNRGKEGGGPTLRGERVKWRMF